MLNPDSQTALNQALNDFLTCSYAVKAAANAFRYHSFPGFCYMAKWEGHERWRRSKKIKHFMADHNAEIVLAEIKAPTQQKFDTVPAALEFMHKHELMLLEKISAAYDDTDCQCCKRLFGKLYDRQVLEVDEIHRIFQRASRVANDPCGLMFLDKELYQEYYPKFHG